MKTVITLCCAILLLAGCDETKQVIDAAGNVQLSGKYNVTEIGGSAVSENVPHIIFTALDKGIKGNTGCNSFFGKYTLDLYALSFSEIASTEMACDQPIMDVENAFLNALNQTGSYALQNGILTLYSKTDRSVLLTASKEQTGN
ncbi:MAG TPA: META domain-containing protein [Flavobacteriaceae bacterium]|nr:META domain-containing protein [Flavobacteriaceae bacterium]MCB9212710.1 META domain-containing protein [Alteromonas sp.]HPF11775.1 META domain-containing protein [Flavobacteriaceae bacterium]HQU20801.1 META domain-containing protein [Flavobacteriaceae bacterium]HQU64976.1 META domain-containing protein [Flavobacteriaceae bacterium]